MNNIPRAQLSILLVCPTGLAQMSLVTAVNAFSWATVVARAKDGDSALAIAREMAPDVLLADAYFLGDFVSDLLLHTKAVNPKIILVVLAGTSLQKKRFLGEGADIVLDYSNMTRQFSQVLSLAQSRANEYE
jgi:DNA-binding NarL/FixJ family response regulator